MLIIHGIQFLIDHEVTGPEFMMDVFIVHLEFVEFL